MELRTVKGTRDLLPADKLARDALITKLKAIFEKYGYNPLETPALELQETLASKYAGGAEILKEVFTLQDNADRNLGLRYDLTVPFARVIASNQELKRPFKRYQIDRVWRNGPIKLGRYREFYQCDVDVVGIKSLAVEAELLAMIEQFFSSIDVPIIIKVNNRKLLSSIMSSAEISVDEEATAILALDKLAKVGPTGVRKELLEKGLSERSADALLAIVSGEPTLDSLSQKLPNCPGIAELREVFAFISDFGVINARFDVSLARGLSYYTGTIWEVFMADGSITSSIGAGGRYDNMVGQFLDNREQIPAVGTSFGLDVIIDGLRLAKKIEQRESVVDIYIVPIKTLPQSIKIVQQLRAAGVRADLDMNGKGPSKNMEWVNRYKIPYVAIIGEDELKEGVVMLKDMQSGKQEKKALEDVITIVRTR